MLKFYTVNVLISLHKVYLLVFFIVKTEYFPERRIGEHFFDK
jgi:hypothetical protein